MSLFEKLTGSEVKPIEKVAETASKGNVSSRLLDMLYDQLAHEAYNAHLYLKIASNLKNQGLDNIGAHFQGQFEEENGHQALIQGYLTDRNENVVVHETPKVDVNPVDILDIAEAYVKQERLTTQKLKDIAKAAWDEWDLITFQFLQDMINKQRAEEDEAMTFQDQAEMTTGNPHTVLLWNLNYGK